MQYELRVNQNDLLEGLNRFEPRNSRELRKLQKVLGKIRGKPMAELAFDGKFFSIEALDRVAVVKAEGEWPGIATVSASVVVAFATAPPPAGDPVIVTCDGEHLRFGSLTVGCTWQSVAHTLLQLPAAPDWIEALSLKYRSTRAQILAGGYERDIQKAERKLDKLIKKVVESLSPLGISEQDIQLLVERRLTERYAK
jgi:hypothetical protein